MLKALRPLLFAAGCLALLTGCQTISKLGPYSVTAYKPHDPSDVSVKVSLSKQIVYVKEGPRLLMAAACTVGIPSKPTPKGNFRIYQKLANKRSGSYGFDVHGDRVIPAEADKATGRYVGYPMPFWCEFAPQYGFHQGYVWPMPRSHGCIRLAKQAQPKFYELVRIGTPVNIATSQPEDKTIGQDVRRPTDFNDPDPAPSYMISPRVFEKPAGSLLISQ